MSDTLREVSAAYRAARLDEEEAWEAFDIARAGTVARQEAWDVYLAAAERADQAFLTLRAAHVRAAAA